MYIPRNGSPLNYKRGMQDNSIPPLVRSEIGDPIHKPLVFGYSARGRENEAFPVAGDNLLSMFGRSVIDTRSDYATFYTPMIQMFNANANEMMFQRVMPDDAKTAYHRMCVEYIEKDVPVYQRDAFGTIEYDGDGAPITTGVMPGMVFVFRQIEINSTTGEFRNGKGTTSGPLGAGSKTIPLWDIKGPYRGEDVNGFGYRLSVLHPKSDTPVDSAYSESVGSRVYGLEFIETLEGVTSPVTWNTLTGASSVKFAFKPGAYYEPLRQDLDFEDVVPKSYRKMIPDFGMLPDDGPFEEFHIYRDNLELLLKLAQSKISDAPADPYLVDIFNGVDLNGNPYDGLQVNPTGTTGASHFSSKHSHFFTGGENGTLTNEKYDELVRREMMLFPKDGKVTYDDELKYSLGCFWDFGFSFDTKEALVNLISRSRNTFLMLCPQVYSEDRMDIQAEESAKIALNEMVAAAPESIEFGTPVARCLIMGQTAYIRNSSYKPFVPALYTLASMFSKYMGAKEGTCKPSFRFGRGKDTVIEDIADITLPYKKPEVYASDWEVGLITARSYDYYRAFIPAIQTAYPNDRSVLNNALFTFLMTYVFRVSDRVWADFSGESRSTREELAQDVEAEVTRRLTGRLDGIADIVPHARFTAEDISNGYSITLDINAYGGVMTTQFNTSIRVYRREG